MKLTNSTSPIKVQALFDRLAPEYDRMNNVITLGIQQSWRKKTLQYLNFPTQAKILDLCCGTGHWTLDLAHKASQQSQIIGVDFSSQMLAVAYQKIQRQALTGKINLLRGDVMQLPFAENSFDLVTIGFGLRNVSDFHQVLKEMVRVVRPGGQVACLETSKPPVGPLRLGWQAYFSIVPWLAQIFGSSLQDYSYLKKTAYKFPAAPELAEKFRLAGLQKVEYHYFTFGAGALHIGYKPNKFSQNI
ncbi:demethylmenaquinone methyltransferase [Liquorilactobacillus sicerae]|uniref:demethylmenaquinone methyltransferase n=1 Tax=Liquorilactobacillus sicerae TaxID=1416943 RepID=UPI0024810DBF|nr:demethylmenaquinone methyltransferase [Liquorilactobacillus sicerae]